MGINRNRLRNFVLFALVILSFLLSYELWTAGRNIGEGEEETTGQTTQTNVSLVTHQASDVFRPTQVAYHTESQEDALYVSPTYPLRNLMAQEFEATTLNRIIRTERLATNEYINMMQEGEWLEFVYTEELPIGVLDQKFEEIPRENTDEFFNRVLVNVHTPDFIYFYHTGRQTVHVALVSEEATLEIESFLNFENLQYVQAVSKVWDDDIFYLPTEPVSIPNRTYVIDQLPNLSYINSFFPDTSLVDVRSSGDLTRYIDLTKEVSINESTNTLTYLRQISDPGELDPTTRFRRSFEQINRFENWSDTFVLSDYNRSDESLSFRREIDGIPVFSSYDHESVSRISLVESGVTELKLPMRFIRTPIAIPENDAEGATKELMSGVALFDEIENHTSSELSTRVEDFTIGYQWTESEEDSQVINFTPEWYLKVDNVWMTYTEFMDLNEEVADGL